MRWFMPTMDADTLCSRAIAVTPWSPALDPYWCESQVQFKHPCFVQMPQFSSRLSRKA